MKLLLIFLLTTISLFGASVKKEQQETQKYFCKKKPSNIKITESYINWVYNIFVDKGGEGTQATRREGIYNLPFKKLCSGLVDENKKNTIVDKAYLSDIVFDSKVSSYTCKYIKDGRKFTCDYSLDELSQAITSKSLYKSDKHGKVADDTEFFKAIDNIVAKDILDLTDVNNLSSLLNKTNFDINIKEIAKKHGLWLSPLSKEYDGLKLSNLFTGMVLLDGSFIKGVDEATNEIQLTTEAENELGIIKLTEKFKKEYAQINTEKNLKQLTSAFYKEPTVFRGVATETLADIFDKKFFGYYVNAFSFLMIVIEYVSYIMLGIAVSYYGFLKSGKSVFGIGVKEDGGNQEEDKKLKQKIAGIAVLFTIGFTPIPSDVNLGMNTDGTEHNVPTTGAKYAFGYLAQYGADFANKLSDGSYYYYMKYILSKLNIIDKKEVETSIISFKKDLIITKGKYIFFNRNCEKAFNNNTFNTFIGINDTDTDNYIAQLSNVWLTDGHTNIFDTNSLLGTTNLKDQHRTDIYIDPLLCGKLESEIAVSLKNLKQKKDFLINLNKSYSNIKLEYKKKKVAEFIDSQFALQSRVGWLNIATLPLLNTYLESVAVLSTDINTQTTKTKDIIAKSTIQNLNKYSKNVKTKDKKDDSSFVDAIIKKITTWVSQYAFYFMLPGFEDINNMCIKIYSGIGSGIESGLGAIPLVKKLSSRLPFGLSVLNLIPTDTAVSVVSLLSAIYLYKLMVKLFLSFLVALFILIKVVDWVMSIIKYFFASPFIIFSKLKNENGGDVVNKFIARGFIMFTIVPLLIVSVSVMFVISYEIASSLYSFILSMISLMLEQSNAISSYSGNAENIKGLILTSSIRPLFEVFFDLFMIYIAYNIIMHGDKKILEQIGYKDDVGSGASEVMNDIKYKLARAV